MLALLLDSGAARRGTAIGAERRIASDWATCCVSAETERVVMNAVATENVSIIGFDSAWTDNQNAPGAVCIIRIDGAGRRTLVQPSLVSFDQALTMIEAETAPLRIVALDQPTIVPNVTGMRPVDRVAASLISWLGGGVQPANRSKIGMFDDAAPVWRFKERLGAVEDPEASRGAVAGLFLMEVFPALALPSLNPAFCGRLLGPRYNPARRKTFTLAGWHGVIAAIRRIAVEEEVVGLMEWADHLSAIAARAKRIRIGSTQCFAPWSGCTGTPLHALRPS